MSPNAHNDVYPHDLAAIRDNLAAYQEKVLRPERNRHTTGMSGTAPRPDPGPCDIRACIRPYGHKGEHSLKRCQRPGCDYPTRNIDERYCTLHEDRATYERYAP